MFKKDSLFPYLLPLLVTIASYPLVQFLVYLQSLTIPAQERGEDALYLLVAIVYVPILYLALAGSIIYLCIGIIRSVHARTKRK